MLYKALGITLLVAALAACDNSTAALDTMTVATLATNTMYGDPDAAAPSDAADGAFPSTNVANAHFGAFATVESVWVGGLRLQFDQPYGYDDEYIYRACWEYRADDAAPLEGQVNPNPDVYDGLWPYGCIYGSPNDWTVDVNADSHVDVRLAFGSEYEERFDWTRFYVLTPSDVCKDGGWRAAGFRNQGQCLASYKANENAKPHN